MDRSDTAGRKGLRAWLDDPAHPERSQAALAAELGISQPSVSGWLTGKARPEPHLRKALELITGVPEEAWDAEDERALLDRVRARHPGDEGSVVDRSAEYAQTPSPEAA